MCSSPLPSYNGLIPHEKLLFSIEKFHTDVLPRRLVTLAEVFQVNGYRTGSVGANVHIQEKTGARTMM